MKDTIQETQQEILEKKLLLQGFQDLPPDIPLAHLKIEESKTKRNCLTQKKACLLENMANALR